jgi:SAM-dependent methyltransferase
MSCDPAFSYDSVADAYAAHVDSAPYNALYERPAMLDLLPPMANARVMDAGCGAGWYALQLAMRGASVTAVDSSPMMIEHARRRFSPPCPEEVIRRVELRVADLAQPMTFAPDASFDVIVSSLVLHYLRDWTPALREFRRILTPAGWLVFSTTHPLADALRLQTSRYAEVELIHDQWEWLGTVTYYRRSLTAIVDALTDCGFAIERLIEPKPTEAFRRLKADSYERLLKQPEFLMIRARPWSVG